MDLSSFKELGIAVVAVGVMGWITWQLIKELAANRKDYTSFVLSNNHNSTEMMEKNIMTMVEVKNAIENHNKALEKLIDKLGN